MTAVAHHNPQAVVISSITSKEVLPWGPDILKEYAPFITPDQELIGVKEAVDWVDYYLLQKRPDIFKMVSDVGRSREFVIEVNDFKIQSNPIQLVSWTRVELCNILTDSKYCKSGVEGDPDAWQFHKGPIKQYLMEQLWCQVRVTSTGQSPQQFFGLSTEDI